MLVFRPLKVHLYATLGHLPCTQLLCKRVFQHHFMADCIAYNFLEMLIDTLCSFTNTSKKQATDERVFLSLCLANSLSENALRPFCPHVWY